MSTGAYAIGNVLMEDGVWVMNQRPDTSEGFSTSILMHTVCTNLHGQCYLVTEATGACSWCDAIPPLIILGAWRLHNKDRHDYTAQMRRKIRGMSRQAGKAFKYAEMYGNNEESILFDIEV